MLRNKLKIEEENEVTINTIHDRIAASIENARGT
jgi:hypothetical protein